MKNLVVKTWIGNEEESLIIVSSDLLKKNEPLKYAYGEYGQLMGPEGAGDYSLFNFECSAKSDMKEEGAKVFGKEFLNATFCVSERVEIENAEEIGLSDKEEEINEFISEWEKKNYWEQTGDYLDYWDGSNYQSLIIDGETARIIEDEEAEDILNAYEQAEFEEKTTYMEAKCNGYRFTKSFYEGRNWYVGVEEI